MKPQITMYLDKRRAKSGNLYPLKIRVWDPITRKAQLYPTQTDITLSEFQKAWETQKPRKEFQALRIRIEAIKAKAQSAAESLTTFTFEAFEKKLFMKTGSGSQLSFHFNEAISKYKRYGQISTADNYSQSLKSLLGFNQYKRNKATGDLSFYQITPEWLHDYENYMVKQISRNLTTVGFYLRPLRAIFNKAIAEKEIPSDCYPFGNRLYQIPASRNIKKALDANQLKLLRDAIPANEFQQKARDFWFFSYFSNGMNIKDIALLKHGDIKDGRFHFYRAKTLNTNKSGLRPITVYLNDFTKQVIEKYGSKSFNPDEFVFSICTVDQSPEQQKRAIQNFTRFINQHIQVLSISIGLPMVSTYWARHSFATTSIRKGASMEMIQESLGHGNMNTTMNYFAGFENKAKKEFAQKLLEF